MKGRAKDSLLETYGEERRMHVSALTQRITHIGELVGERDMERARARDTQLLADCAGQVVPTPRQNVQPALSVGLLSHPVSGQASGHAGARVTTVLGSVFPQPWLIHPQTHARVRMDQLLGQGWRLFLSETANAQWDIVVLHEAMNVQVCRFDARALQECDGVVKAWFDEHRVQAALVRPDHIVFGAYEDDRDRANGGALGLTALGQDLERLERFF